MAPSWFGDPDSAAVPHLGGGRPGNDVPFAATLCFTWPQGDPLPRKARLRRVIRRATRMLCADLPGCPAVLSVSKGGDRLRNVIVHAGRKALLPIALHGAGSHGDDRQSAPRYVSLAGESRL